MIRKQKFLAPVYGIRSGLIKDIKLNKSLLLRNINFFTKEGEFFEEYRLLGDYKIVLEIDYEYNPNDSSEPLPGVFLNIVNKFDASLVAFGEGKVGVAAVIPSPKTGEFRGGGINFYGKVSYSESLNKNLDDGFKIFYEKFSKAYDMRPVAFDIFRRIRDRFTNNDKTIDSCTLLESIFVPEEERIKKPLILNGMKIMGFKPKDLNMIDDLIEYRNAIIHANRKKQLRLLSEAKYTYKWFEDVLRLVRNILYKYIENPWD